MISPITAPGPAICLGRGAASHSMPAPPLFAVLLCLTGAMACSQAESPPNVWGPSAIAVTLPDGFVVQAELAATPEQHSRGLMFRDELPAGRGMIFDFPDVRPRGFWMFQTLIPLDIIWLDAHAEVVEISAHTPPCGSSNPGECPSYGGSVASRYVLEIGAGQAAAHGVEIGRRIEFRLSSQ